VRPRGMITNIDVMIAYIALKNVASPSTGPVIEGFIPTKFESITNN